jgi:hypothetical protein
MVLPEPMVGEGDVLNRQPIVGKVGLLTHDVLNRQPIVGKVGLPDAMVGQDDIPKPMQAE